MRQCFYGSDWLSASAHSLVPLSPQIVPTAGCITSSDCRLGEQGQVIETIKADGSASSDTDLDADAYQWAVHFARDVFNNMCTHHEHGLSCNVTRQSLRSPGMLK